MQTTQFHDFSLNVGKYDKKIKLILTNDDDTTAFVELTTDDLRVLISQAQLALAKEQS